MDTANVSIILMLITELLLKIDMDIAAIIEVGMMAIAVGIPMDILTAVVNGNRIE